MKLLAAPRGGAFHAFGAHRESIAALGVLLFGLACLPGGVHAGDMTPVSSLAGAETGASSVLDGRTFSGEIGHVGEDALTEDVWEFRNGMFASKECEKCGFPESPYWVRFEDDGVRFKVETRCPKTNAVIEWNGVVKGDRIEGTYTWTKERWYWTIEKAFWFEGRLVDAEVAMSGE